MSCKTAVILVHGFASGPKCWKDILDYLAIDQEITESHSVKCYDYATEWFSWNPLQRIPGLTEIGTGFGKFLDLNFETVPNLILVGHSQGGLVIQSYLKARIDAHRGMELAKIRSVILFATPNFGSTVLFGFRRLVFAFAKNAQELSLRVLNPEISAISRAIERDVLRADSAGPDSCPIPFQAFWGLQDNVVPEASARGCFEEGAALPGNHFTIIRPRKNNPNDMRLLALKEAILHPIGHPAVFELDEFEVRLTLFPRKAEERSKYWFRASTKLWRAITGREDS